MISKQIKLAGAVAQKTWNTLRKPTTPTHWALGIFFAALVYAFGLLAGFISLVAFALWERWNDNELLRRQEIEKLYNLPHEGKVYLPEGAMDFWECGLVFVLGMILVTLFHCLHFYSITWLTGTVKIL